MVFVATTTLILTACYKIVDEALPPTSFLGSLTAMHANPVHAVCMHRAVRSRHSLAMHFGTFSGSEAETLDAMAELVEARETGRLVDATDAQSTLGEHRIGEWWEEGGMGWINVGETAMIPVGNVAIVES